MRSVIICSDKSVQSKITGFLRRHGATVLGAFFTPFDALECIVSKRPDIIFADIGMIKSNKEEVKTEFETAVSGISVLYFYEDAQRNPWDGDVYPPQYLLLPFVPEMAAKTDSFINPADETAQAPDALTIKCFGKFKVYMNKAEIKLVTKKVRELFAFLLCHYNRNIYREDIIRTLFNTGDKKKDSNHFRVTMHRLRAALSAADISKHQVLIDKNYSVKIARGVCDFVDLMDFIQEDKAVGEHNIAWANRIIDSVEGELFCDIDTLWLVDIREYVMVHIEELMLGAAQYYMKLPEGEDTAEAVLTRLIELNDLSELSYMSLLDLYIKTENKTKYLNLYKRYARMLKTEFSSVPERKYVRFYVGFNK